MPMKNMGKLNEPWGICGFTSSLYGLYAHNPAMRVRLSGRAVSACNMVAEIKSFLVTLQAGGKAAMLANIETFTQSFGGVYAGWTVTTYIQRINTLAASLDGLSTEDLAKPINDFSIALPPNAVVEYLKLICDFQTATSRTGVVTTYPNECILGLCDTGTGPYNDLKHYVYYLNGTIHSWGKTFKNMTSTDFDGIRIVGHVITF